MKSIALTVLMAVMLIISSTSCTQDSRPVVGISSSKPSSTGSNYVKAVRKAGGIPMVITMTGDEDELPAERISSRQDMESRLYPNWRKSIWKEMTLI